MTILIDSREHAKIITGIKDYFDKNDIRYYSTKLFVGDYQIADSGKIVVDRKHNLSEIAGNVCQQHKRFTDELQRAKDSGIMVYILIEHSNRIKCLEDVKTWKNPRLKVSPLAVSGERLYKILATMESHYGCKFVFCDKAHTGQYIVRLLKGG